MEFNYKNKIMIKKKNQGGRGIKNLIEEIMTNAGYQPGTVLSRVEYDPPYRKEIRLYEAPNPSMGVAVMAFDDIGWWDDPGDADGHYEHTDIFAGFVHLSKRQVLSLDEKIKEIISMAEKIRKSETG